MPVRPRNCPPNSDGSLVAGWHGCRDGSRSEVLGDVRTMAARVLNCRTPLAARSLQRRAAAASTIGAADPSGHRRFGTIKWPIPPSSQRPRSKPKSSGLACTRSSWSTTTSRRREFVVTVLKGEFRMTEDQAHKVMITAHRRGVCVVAVFTKDVAETKATRATDAGRAKGYPLLFTTEPEE